MRYLSLMRAWGSLLRAAGGAKKKLNLYRLHLGFLIDILMRREDSVEFVCNICGWKCRSPVSAVSRENPSCYGCGSTVRYRSVINALSIALWNKPIGLTDYPNAENLSGIGMTDSEVYAERLAKRLGYTNSYYHREPKLDILNVNSRLKASADFILSSDVLEHVAPPVDKAFQNLYDLLKPGGVLVMTVPVVDDVFAKEHFPNLFDFHFETRKGNRLLVNRTAAGAYEEFNELVFHGGPGETLEMRIFSRATLISELENAGFSRVEFVAKDFREFGIVWSGDKSVPVIAWK